MMPGAGELLLAVAPPPTWRVIAWSSLAIAAACAVGIACDVAFFRRQRMGIMNVVWPITALYAGPLALLAYVTIGRAPARGGGHRVRPMGLAALIGATHCGAGCAVGDVIMDTALFLAGAETLLGPPLLTAYVFDFIAAYLFGILFQYFAIAPMRDLSPRQGIIAAVKADTLSLVAFQIGMYAWMAVYQLLLFHPPLHPDSPVYWFMMQIGMLAGLATSYPMNWFLVVRGIKEAM
ncbi:MAG TPA: DUF4396 domain-containing protein [Tepidisphaeraceae bacterium]|jgi:hypothetical protein|nr:DUF4396 domain-containing protein [Tepidisphaeraceae bacterium]